jgi:2-oxoglutarate dehydrogenase E2 component (dihydrolipoamide succinyltransferase)
MATTLDILAPADQTEGTRSQILRWLKGIGDPVAEAEPLIEIETDKVTVEVPSPASGVLREIVKGEQAQIEPGEVLGRLEPAQATTAGLTGQVSAGAAPFAAETASRTAGVTPAALASFAAATIPSAAPAAGAVASATSPSAAASARADVARLSPAVRRLIGERGLDPSVIRGTGEGGRITVDDVLAHSPTPRQNAPSTAPSSAPTAAREERGAKSRFVPHSAIRKRIAEHMVQSLLQTAPHVTTVFQADLSAVMAHRAAHRSAFESQNIPLTYTAYFLAAAVQAIRAVPEANSRWTDAGLEIYDEIHIGVATAIEGTGLVVPVLRNMESRDLESIARELNRLVTGARDGGLSPSDMRDGTFTISNHGVSGSLLATPIVINQPQSAILGIGKLEKRPVVVEKGEEEKIVVRPQCYVTLTIDHRVMDGHQANRFLQTFVRALQTWPAQ